MAKKTKQYRHVTDINPFGFHLQAVDLQAIKPHEANPRGMTAKERKDLEDSLHKFGIVERPVLNADLGLIAGHQRVDIALDNGIAKLECWVAEKQLADQEVLEYLIRSNKNTGHWDLDKLAFFDPDDLVAWGFRPDELDFLEDDPDDLVEDDEVEEPIFPLAPKFSEKYSYVIIITTNEIDQVNLETMLNLEKQKDYKCNRVGLGRVLTFDQFKAAIDERNS